MSILRAGKVPMSQDVCMFKECLYVKILEIKNFTFNDYLGQMGNNRDKVDFTFMFILTTKPGETLNIK